MDDFCLIIPTNRLLFIKNICNFYSKTKIKVKIVHNLQSNFDSYNFSNIEFIKYEEKNLYKRVLKLLRNLKENYCILIKVKIAQTKI